MHAPGRDPRLPPAHRRRDAIPPPLRRWWAGPARAVIEDTGALRLPALLPLEPNDRLLDASGHGGALAALLAGQAPFARPPVALARPASEPAPAAEAGVRLVRGEPAHLPFHEQRFSVVLAGHCIRDWDDAALHRFLAEAWRVLTHNGILVLWEVAPSRSGAVNATWRGALGRRMRLRPFATVGRLGYDAGFAWIQTLRLQPFLWPPGPRLAVLMRKEYADRETVDASARRTPAAVG